MQSPLLPARSTPVRVYLAALIGLAGVVALVGGVAAAYGAQASALTLCGLLVLALVAALASGHLSLTD